MRYAVGGGRCEGEWESEEWENEIVGEWENGRVGE